MKEEPKLKLKLIERDHIVIRNKVTGEERVIEREKEYPL